MKDTVTIKQTNAAEAVKLGIIKRYKTDNGYWEWQTFNEEPVVFEDDQSADIAFDTDCSIYGIRTAK